MRLISQYRPLFTPEFSVLRLILAITLFGTANAQECAELNSFSASNSGTINWGQFPDFNLPFTVIYGANSLNGDALMPLNHGFSHITDLGHLNSVPAINRAQIYYGGAYAESGQPWETIRSPWANDLVAYENKWVIDHGNLASAAGDPNKIDSDIISFDIERVWRFDQEILMLKNDPTLAGEYRTLTDEAFLVRYKNDMRALYAKSVKSVLDRGVSADTKITSYSDTPIVNTFDNIQGKSWSQWQSDKSSTNFITNNGSGDVGGDFYSHMSFMSPSTYYYYDYPHPFAGEYLSYLLFQIEANKAWSNKPIIPFVWLRYSFNADVEGQYIKPWMAEATAIFPFFSGASGVWLWENPFYFAEETDFDNYEYFIKGLYRLSQFSEFFEGNHELVIETSARDYSESKAPVWRGVVKGDEIVIAAHNPFAIDENEEVNIGVSYGNWSRNISLKGYETKLCKYDMSVLGSESDLFINELTVYPNPSSDLIRGSFQSEQSGLAKIIILKLNGQVLIELEKEVSAGENLFEIDISEYSALGMILQIRVDEQVLNKRLFKK